MLCRDGSRSTLNLLLAGMLSLAFVTRALGQAAPSPMPVPMPPPPPTGENDQDAPPPAPTINRPNQATNPTPTNAPPVDTGTFYAYSLASIPPMIGDSPNGGRYGILITPVFAQGATIPIAGGNGYAKIADDSSPIPTDRVFFDYNFFNHAVRTGNGSLISLNCYTFGVEKTFLDGCGSIEVQAPVDTGLSDHQLLDGSTGDNEGTVFGNMALTLKYLIYKNNCLGVSIGTIVDLPTAPNGSFNHETSSLTIENDSVHVAPFVGFAYAPCCSNFFAIGYVQVDCDANGDPVNQVFDGNLPTTIGRFRDPSLLYLDLSTGYWLFRDAPYCGSYLTGIAPVVELHYTTALQDYHGVGIAIFPPNHARTDSLNLTAGLHFQMGPCSMLTVAAVAPLETSPRDKEFDSELTVQFDRRF